jgi:Ca2+-binding EF-hand superfamily protein
VLGQKATKEEVIKMIEDADRGNKGCLDFTDFVEMVGNPKQQTQNEEENLISKFLTGEIILLNA